MIDMATELENTVQACYSEQWESLLTVRAHHRFQTTLLAGLRFHADASLCLRSASVRIWI